MLSIKVPPLGESIVEATISRWHKNEGDAVAAGDTLVELDTDKITVEVPALKPGVLAKRAKSEGDVVHVDDVLGELDESAVPATASAGVSAQTAAAAPAPAPPSHSDTTKSSPAARRIADERAIDIAAVAGTGRGGAVAKPDVLGVSSGAARADSGVRGTTQTSGITQTPRVPVIPPPRGNGAAPGERETREKMSTRRKRIAENLLQSQHATAHLTTFNEVDMTAINALREKYKEKIEKEHGVKLTFMPLFVRATCQALKQFPMVNAQIDGDSIIYKHYVNMGIAVASDQGLVVPNIKDADRKSTIDLSREISEVAKRARDGKLTMDDLTGGTFTITNGGVFGSLISTPILHYPQLGILGLHKTEVRPVGVDGDVTIRPLIYLAPDSEHRI